MLGSLNNREAAMATPNQKAPQAPVQAAIANYLPFERTFKDALKLAARFQKAQGFREYLRRRAAFVVPAVALFALISIACAAATVILLAERHAMLALPGMLLAPFVLVGSFFVEAYVFFSWLEGRALAQALGRRGGNEHFDFGPLPRVPWVLGALFLVAPLLLLWAVSGTAALVLILLAVLIIGAIARFDR
jgi:hypothetical protein